MDRSTVYTPEAIRAYDHLKGWVRGARAMSYTDLDLLGGNTTTAGPPVLGTGTAGGGSAIRGQWGGYTSPTQGVTGVLSGFRIVSISTNTFKVDIGTAYVPVADLDLIGNLLGAPVNTGYGDLSADTTPVVLQCVTALSGTLSTVKPSTSGSNFYLVYVTPTQSDSTDADDPNTGGGNATLPYFNVAVPNAPLIGPPGSPGTANPTVRVCSGTVSIVGASGNSAGASTGTAAQLATPAGGIPLYIIQYRSTDGGTLLTTNVLTTTNFVIPGRIGLLNVGGGGFTPNTIGAAPVLMGFTDQHHLGYAGGAPQLDMVLETQKTNSPANWPLPNGGFAGSLTTGTFAVTAGTGVANCSAVVGPNSGSATNFAYDIPGQKHVQQFFVQLNTTGIIAANATPQVSVTALPWTPTNLTGVTCEIWVQSTSSLSFGLVNQGCVVGSSSVTLNFTLPQGLPNASGAMIIAVRITSN